MVTTRIASIRPRDAAGNDLLLPLQVKRAYNYPAEATGAGVTIGIVELGGAFSRSDLDKLLSELKVTMTGTVNTVEVAGGKQNPDDSNSSTEVAIDVQLAAAIAREPTSACTSRRSPTTGSSLPSCRRRRSATSSPSPGATRRPSIPGRR